MRYDAPGARAFLRDADQDRPTSRNRNWMRMLPPPRLLEDTPARHPSQGPQLPSIPSPLSNSLCAADHRGQWKQRHCPPLSADVDGLQQIPDPRIALTDMQIAKTVALLPADRYGWGTLVRTPVPGFCDGLCSNGSRQRTRPHPERPGGVRHVAEVVACSCQVPAYANCQPGHAILQRSTQPLHHPISGRLLPPNRDACSLARPI